MRFKAYTPEELENYRSAARQLAEDIKPDGEEIMETLIGAAVLTECKGVTLAVIIVHQDEHGPLFQGRPGTH
jgi:hypothetical protein